MKNGILILAIGLGTLSVNASVAATFMDDARDMLRSEREELARDDSENENADSVSKWGQSARAKNRAELKQANIVGPISDDSFAVSASGGGRAPASVNSREPAALPELQPPQQKLDSSLPPRALVREAQRKKAYQEAALIATDQGFFPSTVFVTQGIPVRLFVTGASNKSQCFIMDSFGVRRQIKSQKLEEISFVPETAGTYVFTCPMNGARGSVVVREMDVGSRVPASAEVSQAQ